MTSEGRAAAAQGWTAPEKVPALLATPVKQ